MINHFKKLFDQSVPDNHPAQKFLSLFFFIYTGTFTYFESAGFSTNYFDPRLYTTISAIVYFLILFKFAGSENRRLMLLMLPLSLLGEIIIGVMLELYDYRRSTIPLYVPFGHAIIFISGLMASQTAFAKKHDNIINKIFFTTSCIMFLVAAFLFGDFFSLILGALFFLSMRRKKWNSLYYYTVFYALYVELWGTHFKAWTWVDYAFTVIPSGNPPVGAVFLYMGGAVLLFKLSKYIGTTSFFKMSEPNAPK